MKQFRFVCLLVILLAAVKSEAQVDSFRVSNIFFYASEPKEWDIDTQKDSVSLNYGDFNLIYRHPVHSQCIYAFIGVMIHKVKEPEKTKEPLFPELSKSREKVSPITFHCFDGFVCAYFKNEVRDRKCHTSRFHCSYLYRINDSLEIITTLFSSVDSLSENILEDSLFNFTRLFLTLNKNSIYQLNPSFRNSLGTASFYFKNKPLLFPILTEWKNYSISKEDSSNIQARRVWIENDHNTEDSPVSINISIKPFIDSYWGYSNEFIEDYYYPEYGIIDISQDCFNDSFPQYKTTSGNNNRQKNYSVTEENYITSAEEYGDLFDLYFDIYTIKFKCSDGSIWKLKIVMSATFHTISELIYYNESFDSFFSRFININDLSLLAE